MSKVVTLHEFIMDRQSDFPFATGELSRLLSDIAVASKIVSKDVRRAGLLENFLGAQGSTNVQGEEQQKLDVIADNQFIQMFQSGGEVCGIASEENDDFMAFDSELSKKGKYVVLFDPLDGSSNIDVNVSIGTIFSIYRRKSEMGGPATMEDMLQKGTEQVAAGYVLYGSSTMLVFSTGHGVNGFTYEPSLGEFFLSHPKMKVKDDGNIFSVNEGNYRDFSKGVRDYIEVCKDRRYAGRYIGSLVADFHRNLLKGGIYMYPGTEKHVNGKLRLLYECNALAFLIEQAGGMATDGKRRILDLDPTELHQRTPFFVGPTKMVQEVMEMMKNDELVTQ